MRLKARDWLGEDSDSIKKDRNHNFCRLTASERTSDMTHIHKGYDGDESP